MIDEAFRRITAGLAASAASFALVLSAPLAYAQDDADDGDEVEFETFQVTGSRIQRSDYETAQPVMVIDREEIDRTGLASIGELIKNLPQAGASLGRAFNNGGDGSVEIDLRNLGSSRVLVLVDGRRWIPGTRVLGGGGVDLSTIPVSIVERIEILQDGASAVYGSDAVAGVVNIITRKDFQGLETRFQYGQFLEGDGQERTASFAAGQVSGDTSVFFDVSYRKIKETRAGDRDISAVPTFGVPNTSRGSFLTPAGSFLFVPRPDLEDDFQLGQPVNPCFELADGLPVAAGVLSGAIGDLPNEAAPVFGPAGMIAGIIGDQNAPNNPAVGPSGVDLCFFKFGEGTGGGILPDYSAFDFNTDAFNFAPLNYLDTPQERTSLYSQMTHRITDSITAGAQILYNVRESEQELANNPLIAGDLFPAPFSRAFVDELNQFNPFCLDTTMRSDATCQVIGMGDPAAELVGAGAIGRRLLEEGPRVFRQKNQTFRTGLNLGGNFDLFNNFMSWDTGFIYSDSQTNTLETGLQDIIRVANALGPPDGCTNTDNLGVPGDDGDQDGACVPLDVFNGVPSITQDQLQYVGYVAKDEDRNSQRILFANLSSEIGQTAAFLPAPLGIAMGIESRVDTIDAQPDPLKVTATSSTNSETATSGETKVVEGYVEMAIPVLRDLPFVEDLTITAAVRRSEYTIPNATETFIEVVQQDDGMGMMVDVPLLRERSFDAEFDNTSGKLGIEYRPVPGMLLRGGYSNSFRAPAVSELFLGALQSFPSQADPCSNYASATRDGEANIENIRTNCDADGVPAGYAQSGTQIATVFGGNPDLEPETADSFSVGFVMSPGEVFGLPALDGIDVVVDFFRYELENFITVPGAGQVLGLCYESDPENRALCEFVNRTEGGQIANLQTVFSNFAELNTDGADIDISWDIPFLKRFGNFRNLTTASYTHSYEIVSDTPTGPVVAENVGFAFGVTPLPRWKVNNSFIWELGPWSASWDVRFIDQTFAICDDGSQGLTALNGNNGPIQSLEELGLCSNPGDNPIPGGGVAPLQKLERTVYNDFQFGYRLPWISDSLVTVGVTNAFDQDPPVNYTALANSFNVATYDIPGVRPYLRFQKDF